MNRAQSRLSRPIRWLSSALKHLWLLCCSLKYCLRPRPAPRICLREDPSREPLISVIIPTYNWSGVLKLAIHSVLWQTWQDFELLVMGDGCTDDSASVVASFGDARVRWHNLPVNSGHQSAPNNAGLKLARGRYVALLGHDDIWHQEHLRTLIQKLNPAQADLASALVEIIGPEGSNIRVVSGFVPSGLLIKREAVERIGGWSDYRTTSLNPDQDFLLRLRSAGSKFVSTGELTVFKFNSALRKNSYRERPCHEQAVYVRRIENERLFMVREVVRVIYTRARRLPTRGPDFTPPPDAKALGWEVTQFRKYRGLEGHGSDPDDRTGPGRHVIRVAAGKILSVKIFS